MFSFRLTKIPSASVREELPARGSDEHELCHLGSPDDEHPPPLLLLLHLRLLALRHLARPPDPQHPAAHREATPDALAAAEVRRTEGWTVRQTAGQTVHCSLSVFCPATLRRSGSASPMIGRRRPPPPPSPQRPNQQLCLKSSWKRYPFFYSTQYLDRLGTLRGSACKKQLLLFIICCFYHLSFCFFSRLWISQKEVRISLRLL